MQVMKDGKALGYSILIDRFLLLTLQTDHVLGSGDSREIKRRLQRLPTDLTEAYRDVFERMTEPAFARRILGWILRAQRRLRMEELQEALAIEIGVPTLDGDVITGPEVIVRTCQGLVYYDLDSGYVTLSHETLKLFLENNELERLPSHSELAKTCLTYLQLPVFENPVTPRTLNPYSAYKFLGYAASCWSLHIRHSHGELELARALMETFNSSRRQNLVMHFGGVGVGHRYVSNKHMLHFFIRYGLAFMFISPSREAMSVYLKFNERS